VDFFQEYALLIVVLIPVAVVVAMQLYLYLTGERDTLLLPGLRAYPKVDLASPEPATIDAPATEDAEAAAKLDAEEARRIAA